MDVDFFIVGEVKGTEAMYLINAAYTGQISAATVHSLSAQLQPRRLWIMHYRQPGINTIAQNC